MLVLAIETSCDETAAAVVRSETDLGIQVVSSVTTTSLDLHQKTGGVVPEVAAREQLPAMLPVVEEALTMAHLRPVDLDAIAVTQGPGLIGSLLVGAETAKTLALAWKKPLLPINHLLAHVLVNHLTSPPPSLPSLGVIVSGGHTDLILFESWSQYHRIGGTRDDAAGECFDKCARLILGATYPGGPAISKVAAEYDASSHSSFLPRPMLSDGSLEMSFSGLKTAVFTAVSGGTFTDEVGKRRLCYELEQAIVDVLVGKITLAMERFRPTSVLVGGGVVANRVFRERLEVLSTLNDTPLYFPHLQYCGDNAAMIGVTACLIGIPTPALEMSADPGLGL